MKELAVVQQRALELLALGVLLPVVAVGAALLVALGIPDANMKLRLPAPDADYAVALAAYAVFTFVVLAFTARCEQRALYLLGWLAKGFIVFVVMLAYESRYADDAVTYYYAALNGWPVPPGYGRGTEIVIAALDHLYSVLPASFHLAKLLFATLAYAGQCLLYHAIRRLVGAPSDLWLLVAMLLPGLTFWSSMIGKEAVVVFAAGLVVWGIARFRDSISAGLAAMIAGTVLAGAIRLWLIPIFLGPAWVWIGLYAAPRRWRFPMFVAGGAFAALGFVLVLRVFDITGATVLLETLRDLGTGWAHGGSAQRLPADIVTPEGFARFLPIGMFTALFRPLPGEIGNVFGLLAGFENAALLAACLVSFAYALRGRVDPAFWFFVMLIGAWSIFYAAISYQNLGTAVRFKSQILPFMIAMFACVRWRSRQALEPAA